MELTVEPTAELAVLFGNIEPLTVTSYQRLLIEIASGSRETGSSPWLKNLAELSLSILERYQRHLPKTSGAVSAGSLFIKAVVKETIQMVEGDRKKEEIIQRLEVTFRDYAIVAAAPLVAARNPDHSQRNRLLDTFININLRKRRPPRTDESFVKAYFSFNQDVREESLAVQQGIFGELFAYLFLKQAGYTPTPSKKSEDLKGVDFHLTPENSPTVPIQIKTSLHTEAELFAISVKEESARIFIYLNPEAILKNPNALKALFGEETPDKSCIISFTEKFNQALSYKSPAKR